MTHSSLKLPGTASASKAADPAITARDTQRSWVIITDPGCVPDRKGPFLNATQLKRFLREAMAGRPYSHLMVLTCSDIQPGIEDGTQCLEMLDARSFPTTRKHRERLKSIRLPAPLKTSAAPRRRAQPAQGGEP